jgi:hypothetical protein
MRIHATKAELDELPDWVADFLNAAWATPDEQGQRAAVGHFKGQREIAGRFADRLREALQNPAVCDHNIAFVPTEKPHFIVTAFIMDRPTKIAYDLMLAWNSRATLAPCEICGSLIQPGKGRVARTCSDVCRQKLHRQELYKGEF